jgi:hypothetical protein
LPVLECSRCNELYYSAHGSTELACAACGCGVWRVFEDEVSFARVSGLARRLQPGDHAALLYADVQEAAGFCADYVRDGLSAGERAIIAVPGELQDELLSRLQGSETDGAIVLDAERIYGPDFDPEGAAREYADLANASAEPVRLLSGPGGDAASEIDPAGWRRYERITHELVVDLRVTALCVYDGRSLPVPFSPLAVETHSLISRGGGELRRNSDFRYEAAE